MTDPSNITREEHEAAEAEAERRGLIAEKWNQSAEIARLRARCERLEAALRRLVPGDAPCWCAWIGAAPCAICQAREALKGPNGT